MAHEERRQVDTYDWVDQVEPVGVRPLELAGQQGYYLVDDAVQHESGYGSKEADAERQYQQQHFLADMLLAPCVQTGKDRGGFCLYS